LLIASSSLSLLFFLSPQITTSISATCSFPFRALIFFYSSSSVSSCPHLSVENIYRTTGVTPVKYSTLSSLLPLLASYTEYVLTSI
jgi:hypothetical protein